MTDCQFGHKRLEGNLIATTNMSLILTRWLSMSLAKCIALIVVSFNNPIGQRLPARLLTKREGGGGGGGGGAAGSNRGQMFVIRQGH